MTSYWRKFMRGLAPGYLWASVWLISLAVPFMDSALVAAGAALGWLSALALAPGRHHGLRLVKLAASFFCFWAIFLTAVYLVRPTTLKPILNLSVWLALGLNLMLAKTPLELSLSTGQLLAPIVGRRRSQKIALSLALLARLIPRLLETTLTIRATIQSRVPELPLSRRLTLGGRAIIREALTQNEHLARALVKRWPW